jgi:hypothetical protein
MSGVGNNLKKLEAFAPLADHVGMLRMLLKANEGPDARKYLDIALAIALEKAGEPEEALASWRDAKAAGLNEYLAKPVEAAITRLSGAGVKKS